MARKQPLRWRVQHWLENVIPGVLTCREFEETLDDYLDGELGPVARRMVDLHIRTCPLCKRYLRAYDKARYLAVDALNYSDDKALDQIPEDLVHAIIAARDVEAAR